MLVRCNRSPTSSSVCTAWRTPRWYSQCAVRLHPAVAASMSLMVALQTGSAFPHGNASTGTWATATMERTSAGVVVVGSSGSMLPFLSCTAAIVCSRHAAATLSGDHPAVARSHAATPCFAHWMASWSAVLLLNLCRCLWLHRVPAAAGQCAGGLFKRQHGVGWHHHRSLLCSDQSHRMRAVI